MGNIDCKLKYATKDGGLTAESDSNAAILVSEGTYPYVPPAASSSSSTTTSSVSTTSSATTSSFSYAPSSTADYPCPAAANGTVYMDTGTSSPGLYNIYCGQNILNDDLDTPPNIDTFDECLQACDVYVDSGYGG